MIPISVAFLYITPEFVRLLKTFGGFGNRLTSSNIMVNTLDPRLLFINLLKNLTLNYSNHYIYKSNLIIDAFIAKIATLLNVDILDKRIGNIGRGVIGDTYTYHCDVAGAFFPAIFLILVFVVFLIKIIRKQYGKYDLYVVFSMVSIFVLMIFMKSTPYRTRYELPFFAILCPAIVYMLDCKISKEKMKNGVISIVGCLCILEAISMCVYQSYYIEYKQDSGTRPAGYFSNYYGGASDKYDIISSFLKDNNVSKMGLYVYEGAYEYPIWAMNPDVHIENIFVDDVYKQYEDVNYVPEALVVIENEDKFKDSIEYNNNSYQIVKQFHFAGGFYSLALLE